MKLKISPSLSLPLEFVTQTQAILAKKRVGKSYTAKVQAEELLKAKQQIVAIDPTGAWWGLKSSADGKSPGFPIAIFGGEHGDVPLEETAGDVIARAIIEQRFSAILDLTLFRKAAMNRFMADFLETLYHLNREAMHLFVDEADLFAPQKPFDAQARTLGAMEDVIRRGGIRGIGCTLITQRSAVINKDVLTQVGVLTVLRLSHPNDIKPINEWVSVHGEIAQYEEMKKSLPALPRGTAWIWAPEWELFECVKIRELETFDSGATPKAGEAKRIPKVIAGVDLQKLGDQITATIERQKQNDPSQLKKQIAALKKELAKTPTVTTATKEVKVVDQKAIQVALKKRDQEWARGVRDYQKKTAEAVTVALKGVNAAGLLPVETEVAYTPEARQPRPQPIAPVRQPARQRVPKAESNGDGDLRLRPGAQRMLAACASWNPKGITEGQVAAMSGVKRSGGSFGTYKSSLVTSGLIQIDNGLWFATDEGIEHAGDNIAPAPTSTEEVLALWKPKLRPGAIRMLDVLVAHSGEAVTTEQLSEESGVSSTGGSFGTYLSSLATADLIVKPQRGMLAANVETLFL